MKRILLLGANGQLGSDLRREFTSVGYELRCVTRDIFDAEKDNPSAALAQFSGVDVVINCIAYINVDECEKFPDKAFRINATFPLELAKWCQEIKADLFHISTDFVFDGESESPYDEDAPIRPINVYGMSKAMGEQAVRMYCNNHFVFRVSSLFGVAGASGRGGNFIETMISKGRKGDALRVVQDLVSVPTHSLDVARAVKYFVDRRIKDYGTYHCVSQGCVSWYGFARAIFELAGINVELTPVSRLEYKLPALRPRNSVLNPAKVSKHYAMPEWHDALTEYLREKNYLKLN